MLPVIFMTPAKQYFKKLKDKQLKSKFEKAINEIRQNPEAGRRKTGDLSGVWGYDVYHQGTNYEIAYRISVNDDGEIVVIIMAGTRENFWAAIKNYLQ